MNKAESLATRMLEAVKGHVARSMSALDVRFADLEARIKAIPTPKDGRDGKDGTNGKDADPAVIEAAVQKAVSAIPVPKAGKDGSNGKDADEAGILARLTEHLLRAVDALPKAKDGRDGRDAPEVDTEALAAKVYAMLPTPKDGRDGKDAAPIDFDAVVEAAVKRIPDPPKGNDGRDGKDAPAVDEDAIIERVAARIPAPKDGKDGLNGKDGESVHPDTVSLMVRDAVAAEVQKIPPAKDGKDGAAGRDALEFSPLPNIDEAKSYPAGTWAKYCGGLIKAVRKTDPITESLADAGWEVMVEGLSAIVVTQGEDLRTFSVGAMLTSGTKAVTDFVVPVPIDRGVYKAGTYQKSDVVTYGGSQWIALRETKSKPPSDDWRCQVQRGRDGKDAA